MLYCGIILSRSGHFNASNSLALASKGINAQRRISTISQNKFSRPHLLNAVPKSLPELQKCDRSAVWTAPIFVRHINSSYRRALCLRKIHTGLQAQCSTCTSDIKKQRPIADISENNVNEADIFGSDASRDLCGENILKDEHKAKTHAHKEHEYTLADIERMYPQARSKLNEVFQSIKSQLNIQEPMKMDFTKSSSPRRLWSCNYKLSWPEATTISGTASTKAAAMKLGALKTLQWLQNSGKLKNGIPIVIESKAVLDMLQAPTSIKVSPESLKLLRGLVSNYESEITGIIKNPSDVASIREIAVSTESSSELSNDSIGDPARLENADRRNEILRNRLADRYDVKKTVLPIEEYRERIIHEVASGRALLIKGDTGCGKTTQVPQYIMDDFSARGRATDCNMIVSQPRRISAISLAERIAHERNERPGDVVGYQVRLKQLLPRTPGGMLFCTTGILLRKMQGNPTLKGYTHVILDEAHERSINTDMLLVLLKRALEKNTDLKVIVMSATINAELFQRYFDCSVVEVPGRTYPVEMKFLEDVRELGIVQRREYVGNQEFPEVPFVDCEQIGELVRWIDRSKPPGAILVFLPGWSEIVKVKKFLEEHRQRGRRDLIVPVHSRISHHDQAKIFETPPSGVRKIVLATDIAETGITVTDVVYVVDSATQKAMKWHERRGIATMDNQFASQANLLQRKGRAGRVQPGTSYHMVTKAQFQSLPAHPLPEVLRSSLEKTVLDCKTYSCEKVGSFLGSMPQPPTTSAVLKAIEDLREIGALDQDENLTPLGKRIAMFTVHPKLSKAMVYSSIFQCVSPMLTIASAMSAEGDIFVGTLFDKEGIRKIKKKYHPASDHNSIGWMFAQWASINMSGRYQAKEFCLRSKLHPDRMFVLSKVRELHAETLVHCHMLRDAYSCDDLKDSCNEYHDLDELVRGVMLAGLDQLLYQRGFDIRKNKIKKGTACFIMEDGNRATLTPETVNFKRASWPSPYLTYVTKQHSEERRTSLIRETSMVSPLTALLFTQCRISGYQQGKKSLGNPSENNVLLTVKGRKNFRLLCSAEEASLLLQFRDVMWNVVSYLLERQGLVQIAPGSEHYKVEDFKNHMLQVLAKILSEASAKIDMPDEVIKEKMTNVENDEFSD